MRRPLPSIRHAVQERAEGICEYCRSSMEVTGQDFTLDHILPASRGGSDDGANLCFCCFWCNSYQQATTEAPDPRTRRFVPLFNPRTSNWDEHFRWSPTLTRIIGRTAVGRATIQTLQLNRPTLVRSRQLWARHGLHPPERFNP
jgi:hypothetical protein